METTEIYAETSKSSVLVYQAYNDLIGREAAMRQTLYVPGYKKDRMTWIKPSFGWMMHRSDWGRKENQTTILQLEIGLAGFFEAIDKSTLSSFDPVHFDSESSWRDTLKSRPGRIQFDPDRDLDGKKLEKRAIQIGLTSALVAKMLESWLIEIRDITRHLTDQNYCADRFNNMRLVG